MKKLLFPLLAILVACGFNSCQKDEPSALDQRLVGLWGCTEDDDESQTYIQYTDIHKDGSFQIICTYMGDTKYYECYKGKCTFENKQLLFTATDYRVYFYFNNVLRIGSIRLNQNLTQNWKVSDITADKISALRTKKCTWTRLSAKPADWKPEFFMPEKNPTDTAMVATWDLLNNFTLTEQGFNWYAYNTPQYEGMKLTDKHEISDAFFWVKWLHKKLVNEYAIKQGEGISINSRYSKWALDKDKFSLATSQYEVITYDDAGNETDRKEVIPPSPLSASFNVISFTDCFLVLYCPENWTGYVFTPGKPLSSAPEKVAGFEGGSFFTDFAK